MQTGPAARTVATTATSARRRHRITAALLSPLLAMTLLGSCYYTGVSGEDTRNGHQLRPSEVPTPPAFRPGPPPSRP